MNTDAVVIGAGVLGTAIALELARAGRHVTVVDRGGVGHGSTSASSAVVRFNFSTWAGVAASWEAVHDWQAWPDHLGAATSAQPGSPQLARFERTGMVMLDVPLAPRELFRPLFDRAGVPYQEWDAATLARRVPGIDTGRFWPPARLSDPRFGAEPNGSLGGLYTPDAGFVSDPALAARNLADAAARYGARFLLGSAVTGIDRRADQVAGVRLANGTAVAAPIVVNAAGPWSGQVNALAGVGAEFTIGLRPMRQEVHHVPAPEGYQPTDRLGPCLADLDLGTYLRGEVGGGLLIGGTEPECDPMQWLDDPDQAHPHPTGELFEAQVTRAARRLPGLGVPNRPRGVVGVYDVADDWTPIYDRTDLPGFYVAIGTSGNQFKNAPVVGQFLAAIIDNPEHDTEPTRFVGRHTGLEIDLRAFSRLRPVNQGSSGTVMG